jgi:Zn-dependent protease
LGWSWRLGAVAGIPVRLHWSVGLLLIWLALPALADPLGWPLALGYSLLLLVMLTACVVLHELGHGLMARRLGVGVRDIVLLPIGGMARLEAPAGPEASSARIAIALAGPAANGALAAALAPLLWLVGGAVEAGPPALLREWGQLSPAGFLIAVVGANLALAGLNLLPVVPLDGGRAARAALSRTIDAAAAAYVMAIVALALAAAFAVAGIVLMTWWLLAAASLVALAAARELATAERWRVDGSVGVGQERGDTPAGHRTAGPVD